MAGPQDYLTVKGPEGASYALPKFDLGSQIAQIPTSYQEGQQYGIKRSLQTMYQNGNMPTTIDPATGQQIPDYGGIAQNVLKVAGPEAAAPYFKMAIEMAGSQGDQAALAPGGGAQPQGQPGASPQTYRQAPQAATSAAGPDNIRGTRSGPVGSILPGGAQLTGEGGPDEEAQPQSGAGLGGQPAPFAGNRIPAGGWGAPASVALNDRVPPYGGMPNRPSPDQQNAPPGPVGGGTVTQDGTTGQPAGPTSSREVAQNGPPPDPQVQRLMTAADKAEAEGNRLAQRGARVGQTTTGGKAMMDAAQTQYNKAKLYREEALKRQELTTEEKNARNPSVTTAAGAVEAAKTGAAADTKYYDTVYRGLTGSATIAAQQKQNIALLRQIAESPNFTPGMGSEIALGYQRLAAQFGINPTGAAPREVFNQLAARVLADQFSGMKSLASETGEQGARIFKPMLDIEERANITPNDSLEGVRAKLNLLDKSGDLMMRYGDMADDYKTSHGKLDASFNKQIRGEIAGSRMGGVMPAASGAIPQAPATIKTPEQASAWKTKQGLKSGDPYRTPDGTIRRVK